MSKQHDILYYLNESDEIVTVNSAWNRFARLNNGEGVLSHRVQWWPIWTFISDEPTALIYRQLLARVRAGHDVDFSVRCDGPSVVRFARMSIRQMRSGLLEFRVHSSSETRRRRVPIIAVKRSLAGETTLCGWCMRIGLATDLWLPAEEAHSRTCGGDPKRSLLVSHGSCPWCVGRMLALGRAQLSRPDASGHRACLGRERNEPAVKAAS